MALIRTLFFALANEDELALAFGDRPASAVMSFGNRFHLDFAQRRDLLKALRA